MSIKETAQVYSTLFMDSFPEFKITKPLKTIELFAGYGSQSLALDYLGVGHESIGICEWAWKSILAYKAIHCPNDRTDYSKSLSDDEIFGFLTQAGISTDYNSPLDFGQVKRLGIKKCKEIYNAIIATKDHPDISRAKGSDFLVSDRARVQVLLTYSFPCQDLSNCGKLAGMDEGSGTRSSLLWEVRRILTELKEANQLPDVLLMENVQGVIGSSNLANFSKWVGFLESLGYSSKVQVMEATDYGVPQTRKRCFVVSALGDYSYSFPEPVKLKSQLADLLEPEVDPKYYLGERALNYLCESESKGFKAPDAIVNPKVARTIMAEGDGHNRGGFYTHVSDRLPDNFNATRLLGTTNGHQSGNIYSKKGCYPSICAHTHGNTSEGVLVDDLSKGIFYDKYNDVFRKGISSTLTMPNHNSAFSVVPCANKKGFDFAHEGDGIYINHLKGKRGTVQKGLIRTLKTTPDVGVAVNKPICLNPKVEGKQPSIENRVYDPKGTATALTTSFPTKYAESNLRIRKLTPRECFRLMGVADRDSDRLGGFADTALYHLAGDSIVTTCLMAIFAQFYDGLNWLAKAKEKGIFKDGDYD